MIYYQCKSKFDGKRSLNSVCRIDEIWGPPHSQLWAMPSQSPSENYLIVSHHATPMASPSYSDFMIGRRPSPRKGRACISYTRRLHYMKDYLATFHGEHVPGRFTITVLSYFTLSSSYKFIYTHSPNFYRTNTYNLTNDLHYLRPCTFLLFYLQRPWWGALQ